MTAIIDALKPLPTQRPLLSAAFAADRKLKTGNANPGNIGNDFNKLGLKLWDVLKTSMDVAGNALQFPSGEADRKLLEELNTWRNAVSHEDFTGDAAAGPSFLKSSRLGSWRQACVRLSRAFDTIMSAHLQSVNGVPPW